MKRFLIFLVFVLPWGFHLIQASAADVCENINGAGRFYSKDEDSLSFVKDMLLYNSFRDVLSKKMNCLGMDPDIFWNRIDVKFDAYFRPIEENLRERYPEKDQDGKTVPKNKIAYEKALRHKRLILKKRYGKIERAIKSYSVKKMTRSVKYPNSRYMLVNALVDPRILNDIYYKYTQTREDRIFKKLFLSVHFNLQDTTWTELGVEVQKNFEEAVTKSWKKWLKNKWQHHVKEFVVANEAQVSEFSKFMTLPEEAAGNFVIVESSNDFDTDGHTAGRGNNAIWLKINFTIKKTDENMLIGRRDFEFSGQYLLFDFMTGRLIADYDFIKEKKHYQLEEVKSLSSSIASLVYRIPLFELEKVSKTLGSMANNVDMIKIEVKNLASIMDVFVFIKYFVDRGGKYHVSAMMDSFDGATGRIKLYYRGTRSSIVEFIKSFNDSDFDTNRRIGPVSKENPYQLFLVGMEKREKNI